MWRINSLWSIVHLLTNAVSCHFSKKSLMPFNISSSSLCGPFSALNYRFRGFKILMLIYLKVIFVDILSRSRSGRLVELKCIIFHVVSPPSLSPLSSSSCRLLRLSFRNVYSFLEFYLSCALFALFIKFVVRSRCVVCVWGLCDDKSTAQSNV